MPQFNERYQLKYKKDEDEGEDDLWVEQNLLSTFAQVLHHLDNNKTAEYVKEFLQHPVLDQTSDDLAYVHSFLKGEMRKAGDMFLPYNVSIETGEAAANYDLLTQEPNHTIKLILVKDNKDRCEWPCALVGQWVFWDKFIMPLTSKALDAVCVGFDYDDKQEPVTFKEIRAILYVTRKYTYKETWNNMMIPGHQPVLPEAI